jgi:glycosyltransferase involved in cell wall biosynthesis
MTLAISENPAPRFSLVVCTRGRREEVGELMESLLRQHGPSFEVIIVDQNADDRLVGLLAPYLASLRLRHVRMNACGASRARNAGLDLATGDLIAFPDDDCVYLDGYLETVERVFHDDPSLGCVTGHPTTLDVVVGQESLAGAYDLGPFDVQDRCQEFTVIIRRDVLDGRRFNALLGVGAGTLWGADEGPDLLIRLMRAGCRVRYFPGLLVRHPDKVLIVSRSTLARALSYARGRGCLFRLHGYPSKVVLDVLLRPAVGCGLYLVTLRPRRSAYYFAVLAGRLRGLMMSRSELAAVEAGSRPSEIRGATS